MKVNKLLVVNSSYKNKYYSCHINYKFNTKIEILQWESETKITIHQITAPVQLQKKASNNNKHINLSLSNQHYQNLLLQHTVKHQQQLHLIQQEYALQDGDGGSSLTTSPTAHPSIEIAFKAFTITNDAINNDVSTIPLDTDTRVRVYSKVEASEDQIVELLVYFEAEEFGASYHDPSNEREYYADFTTTSFNPFGANSDLLQLIHLHFNVLVKHELNLLIYVYQLLVQLQLVIFDISLA